MKVTGVWIEGIPLPKPELLQISFAGTKELRLLFNQKMPAANINPACYYMSNGMDNLFHPLNNYFRQFLVSS